MYVDVTSYLNSTYDSTLTDSTASSELGEDAFLQLLMAQLEWQDPLDPMDDTEMVAQLAQFSSLEALQEMTGQLDSMTELLTSQISMSAASYIGKEVEAAVRPGSRTALHRTVLHWAPTR
jgi:flagellar basal-body rod modification protein FlgD